MGNGDFEVDPKARLWRGCAGVGQVGQWLGKGKAVTLEGLVLHLCTLGSKPPKAYGLVVILQWPEKQN